MRGHHDMGGLPAGTVEPAEHDYQLWEKRVDALMVLLTAKGLMTVDELRRGIEALPPDAYDSMSYYERWMHSVCAVMLQRGAITTEELRARLADVETRGAEPAAS